MIPFNRPLLTGQEQKYINDAIASGKFSGDGPFTQKCQSMLEESTGAKKVLLTPSCTHAMELAALLLNIQPGDEVIMPSFTFVSTANPFALRGAKIVFTDIRPDTMNIDEEKIEAAITDRTRAIVPVHYAGVGCNMERIMAIANAHQLYVVEDAAQCVGASYHGKKLGTIGHFGCFSFHDTKNIHCGEGGALLINDSQFIERAEIIREKGTNRSQFLRGQVDKYTWVDIGSSYLASELNAAFLVPQLEHITAVTAKRKALWQQYHQLLQPLAEQGVIELPHVPEGCEHNGHIFYIKLRNLAERQHLINALKAANIQVVFHYIPLHSAKAGLHFGSTAPLIHTDQESERLLRLPMYYDLATEEVATICNAITTTLAQRPLSV